MFTILNRLRGTKAYMAKVISLIIIGGVFFASGSWTLSIAMGIGYLAGESMGWGKWIGGIMGGDVKATEAQLLEKEGTKNGIHWLANKIYPQDKFYLKYCETALALRGLLWWTPVLLPLLVLGYVNVGIFLLAVLVLGLMFPLSVVIANWTTTKFNYSNSWFGMTGAWEHAEVWYGIGQDLVLIALIIILL